MRFGALYGAFWQRTVYTNSPIGAAKMAVIALLGLLHGPWVGRQRTSNVYRGA